MKSNPVCWFEIYVEDMDRARRFYEAVLGVTLTRLDAPVPGLDMMTFPMDMERPGASGALARMPGFSAGRNSTLVYFSCEDCGVEAARVAAAGGRVQQDKFAIGPHGFIALAFDTEGNLFGLHSTQ